MIFGLRLLLLLVLYPLGNINLQESDDSTVLIRELEECRVIQIDLEDTSQIATILSPPAKIEPLTLFQISSPSHVSIKPGEILYISTKLYNESEKELSRTILFSHPEHWTAFPSGRLTATAEPHNTTISVFGVKAPKDVLAGDYTIELQLEGQEEKYPVTATILPEIFFEAQFEDLQEVYLAGYSADLKIVCKNHSNVPMRIALDVELNPLCHVRYQKESIEIPPYASYKIPFSILPNYDPSSEKHFLFFKIENLDSGEHIYRNTLSIATSTPGVIENDLYRRIPSYFRAIALGENNQQVYAMEWAGHGLIDPERNRFIDFFYRIPTNTDNVIYSIDQLIYTGIWEDTWDIELGDTIYTLTTLTQNNRYGRGGGFEITPNSWSFGAHYTQNTYKTDYNPKESCCYLGYSPTPSTNFALNYMNKQLQQTPTANIVSFSSELEFPSGGTTECEVAKNFAQKSVKGDTHAYRFEIQGECFKNIYYDIQKIYAGSAFYGYYTDFSMFNSSLNVPLGTRSLASCSYTDLRQGVNRQNGYDGLPEDHPGSIGLYYQVQKQFTAQATHTFKNGVSLSLNAFLLRAKELDNEPGYNFKQEWGGFIYSYSNRAGSILTSCSFGQQQDYCTGLSTSFLQNYYFFMARNLRQNLWTSFFYQGGNTNYYDAKPWRNAFGASLRYSYGQGSWIELFLQRVNNKAENYQLTQATCNLNHTFRNRHSLQMSAQYFYYKHQYADDFLFLVTYTIPFNLPVGRRKDVGTLNGCMIDSYSHTPIPNATVNCNGNRIITDKNGCFCFPSLSTGEHIVKTEILPTQLMTQHPKAEKIYVAGGQDNQLTIPVVTSCLIEGEILRYAYDESMEMLMKAIQGGTLPDLKEVGGEKGIKVFISKEDSEETYTAYTNASGYFCYRKLRPGRWVIWIDPTQLPDLHELEMNHLILDVTPGEERKIIFKIVPKSRAIQTIE